MDNDEILRKSLPEGLSEEAVNNIMDLIRKDMVSESGMDAEIASYARVLNEEYENSLKNGEVPFLDSESEEVFEEFLGKVKECVVESKDEEQAKANVLDILERLKTEIKDPKDVEKFLGKYASQISKIEKSMNTPKERGAFMKVMSFIRSGLKKGWAFLKNNWGKILVALAVVLLYIYWPKAVGAATMFGHWFGDGNGEGIPADFSNAEITSGEAGGTNPDSFIGSEGNSEVDVSGVSIGKPVDGLEEFRKTNLIWGHEYEGTPEQAEEFIKDYESNFGKTSYEEFNQIHNKEGEEGFVIKLEEALKDIVKGRTMTNPKDGKKHPQFTVDPKEFDTYKNKEMLKKHGAQWYSDRQNHSKSGWNWTAWDDDVDKILNGKIKPTLDEIAKMNGDDPKEVLIALEFLKNEIETIQAGG